MPEPLIIDTPHMPEGVPGCTDGATTVWLDDQLTAVDRRVVLAHELIHYDRGHDGHCTAVVERGIDREVACSLIRLDALGAAAWSEHLWVIADKLDVMPDTVEDRLHSLTAHERAQLEAPIADAHWA